MNGSGKFTRTSSGRNWSFSQLLRFAIIFMMEFDIVAEHSRLLRLTLPRFSSSPEIDISAEHVRLRRSTLPFFLLLSFPRFRYWFRTCAFTPCCASPLVHLFFFLYFLFSNIRCRPRAYACMSSELFSLWNASGPEYARGA